MILVHFTFFLSLPTTPIHAFRLGRLRRTGNSLRSVQPSPKAMADTVGTGGKKAHRTRSHSYLTNHTLSFYLKTVYHEIHRRTYMIYIHHKIYPLLFFALCFISHSAAHVDSSYPYIAGNTFKTFCDFVIDGTTEFNPENMRPANTIFIQYEFLADFFTKHHPNIKHPYIIITHNCGHHADNPIPAHYESYLEDAKIIAWFGQNIEKLHPKMHHLPIGIANKMYPHGNTQIFDTYIQTHKAMRRDKLLYMNFAIWTYPPERGPVFRMFARKPFCSTAENRTPAQYLDDLSHHKFVLSPRGNGLDCHRTWEALLMGSIPVVRSSTLNSLYKDLPVLVIRDWKEVTQEFLEKKYKEMLGKKYNTRKLYADYWFEQIKNCQQQFLATYIHSS